ncbi:MAG TPA: GNAT family N-acetyltransferase [Mycobacteriales bacterium]|nr:GNAT family N-acetyltransferase [Mycobacteriales bacterium]
MELVVVESGDVDAVTRLALRTLWDRAFGDRFSDEDADHAYGGVHVLVRDGKHLVGHCSVVPRRLRFGDGPWCTVGYVEAVATEPALQGGGIGRTMMQRLHVEIGDHWPVALLSTGQATGFYEGLGWERWRGRSFTRTDQGVVPDDEHGGLMILRLDPAAVPDLSVDVTCEDRDGDAW